MNQALICPRFEKAMSLMSQRWTGLVIYQLLTGPKRFCTLESSIGISGRVLSERLKDLEHQGIVKRAVYPETPVRIEYSLTEKGEALEPVMREIEKWSQTWLPNEMK
ncbi:DNA-binding HxlR family transcriptional regulator [Cytobacillus horneckiae]|uniref:Transcriptional regulator n=1 Tax=Cytobacillus horneckiae TaxID=549687 RepID=A0A2N0ZJL2_9BACI|nr:helix-turn-helix domain-containing protein [Cytobacillus horneckiae]MBN6888648.1 helix-turn-helix transcriptional regulator [Cytobacillus horneckiae]MCM3180554.1 helix-turn-helix transcriptional regulator [Cytobacillus horneckiae]MEC1154072.1 helix-turn-helix domain-containing protein [Cytobacillus horneckiae]MED2938647.1 helix-turn-helix domain-containing protein [Cytobacillus horneckiae]PKG29694.1 transcriptional regulator [Cytobacillus horneckiae]